jgi:hypothetical protein
VCHERCSLTETTNVGERVFRRCIVIVNGRCTVCTGKCSYNMHYHDRRLIKRVPTTLKGAISSLANKYSQARKDKAACEMKCETVQETKRFIERSLEDQFIKVRDACRRVKNNCHGFNVAEELCIFVNFLKTDMNSLSSLSVKKKATKFIERLESLADDQQYDDCLTSNTELSSSMSPRLQPHKNRSNYDQNKQTCKVTMPFALVNTKAFEVFLLIVFFLIMKFKTDESISINHSPTFSPMAQVDRLPSGSMMSLDMILNDMISSEDDEQRKKRTTPMNTSNINIHIRDTYSSNQMSSSMSESTVNTHSNRKYAEYTTERLIALSRESADKCKSIAKELNRRCGGTSIGYLSPAHLLTLCEHYASSRFLPSEELVRLHTQLQSDIQQLTDHDPFEILSVPIDKLLSLAAITLCLQNTTK